MNADLAICFTANKTYLPHFAVAIRSFLAHNQGNWNVYLLSDDVTELDIQPIRQMILTYSPTNKFQLLNLKSSTFEHLKGHHARLGIQTYFRLLLPEILPLEIKRALYIDSDVVITSSLDAQNKALSNLPIAGALDPLNEGASAKRGLEKYFNAGVLLLNLTKWRQEQFSQKIIHHKTVIMRFGDQELLNDFFNGQWAEFSNRNNYPAFLLSGMLKSCMKNGEKPALIHFIGMWKPWKYWYKGSWLYWKNALRTPYWYRAYLIPITIINSFIYKLGGAKQ